MSGYAKHLTPLPNWIRLLLVGTTLSLWTAVIALSFGFTVAQAETFFTTFTGATCFEEHSFRDPLPANPALRRTFQGAVHNITDANIQVLCPGLTRYASLDDRSKGYWANTQWFVKVFDRHPTPGSNVSCEIAYCSSRRNSCITSQSFSSQGIGLQTIDSFDLPASCGFYQGNTFVRCSIPRKSLVGESAIHAHQTYQFGGIRRCLADVAKVKKEDGEAPLLEPGESAISDFDTTLIDDLDAKFLEELAQTFRNEDIDESWATEKERELDEYLRLEPPIASNYRVECRKTMCKLTVTLPENEFFDPSKLYKKTRVPPLTGGSVFVGPDEDESFIAYLGLTGRESEFSKTLQAVAAEVYRNVGR